MKSEKLVPNIRFKGFTNTWEKQRLADIVTICTGKLDANAMVPGGKYDFYTSGIAKYKTNTFSFSGKSITIAGNGATVGYLHLADGLFDAYQRTYVLQNFTLDRIFVYYSLLKYLPDKIKEEARASNIPYIVIDMLNNLVIKTGHKNEIRKIGNILLSLESLITFYKRKSEKLENLKKSLLEKMFVSDGEQFPVIRFNGFTNAWEKSYLFEIAVNKDNLRIPVAENLRVKGSTPYYGANGIQGYIKGFTHDGLNILIAEDGANNLDDYPVYCTTGKIWVNNHSHVLNVIDNNWSDKFLSLSIKKTNIRDFIVGGSRCKLNLSELMNLKVNITQNVSEQHNLSHFFNIFEEILTLHKRKCEKLENIKQFLLEKMFC
ncbi:restriction endonuclease subunit S [Mycoplasma sp. VS276A1]